MNTLVYKIILVEENSIRQKEEDGNKEGIKAGKWDKQLKGVRDRQEGAVLQLKSSTVISEL